MSRALLFATLLGAAAASVDSDDAAGLVTMQHNFVNDNPDVAKTAAAAESTLTAEAALGAKTVTVADTTGFIKGGVVWFSQGTLGQKDDEVNMVTAVDATAKTLTLKYPLKGKHAAGYAVSQVKVSEVTGYTATTTITPWDSSSGSSGTSSDSLVSDSLNADSSLRSYSLGSGTSSGSQNSGSSGSYMNNWLWALVLVALAGCIGYLGLMAIGATVKPKKKATKKAAPKPAPAPEPAAEIVVEPLLPALTPLATTSAVVPSYSMVAPMATSAYAAPATTAYAAPFGTAAYAAPGAYV